ncbi:MAG: site-specific DNA-methyltransferase [Mucilaginibacter sp.]|jgi:site-specific DNA-methyltransferase (adenine-specific)|uniref:DNA-methyltransferase n=1 Tax=Mucilaginibacter sp. TaxID=1882438 RepID=UPI003567EDA1
MNLNYKALRQSQFESLLAKFDDANSLKTDESLIVLGDSLKLLENLPDNSVSLILTDPPYHSTKKDNITNDTSFATDESFLMWMDKFFYEWKRVLRNNGSIYVFCSSAMSAKLENLMDKYFNVLSHIVWTKPNEPGFDGWKGKMKKEALRQWYPHSERILFAEPAFEGNLHRSGFGHFLKMKRKEAGLSGHQLTELTGAYGKVNHGGAVSNWETGRNIPSREQYRKICEVLIKTGKVYEMPIYEDVIRPFEVNSSVEFTDVWNFNSVRPYKGKHPAEKPIDMLEHCILSTTFENDIVLDCFAGSGSTAVAALNLNRKSISFEIEASWTSAIKHRIEKYDKRVNSNFNKKDIMKVSSKNQIENQISLVIL